MSLPEDPSVDAPSVSSLGLVAAACLLALGLGGGLYFAGQAVEQGLDRAKTPHIVSVKGLSERAVKADTVLWPLRFVATGNDLGGLQAKIEGDTKNVVAFLKEQGLTEEDFSIGRVDVVDLMAREYRSEDSHDNRYILYGNMMIRSSNVEGVEALSRKIGDLLKQGVVFTVEGIGAPASLSPYYLFTHLSEVKLDMLSEATRNAKAAAAQLARDAGVPLGGLVRASQGVFSVLPGDATPGASEETQVNKTVRVVSTADYALEK